MIIVGRIRNGAKHETCANVCTWLSDMFDITIHMHYQNK